MRMSKKMAGMFMAAALASSGAQAAENGVIPTNLGTEGMQNINIPPPGLYALNYTNYFHASQLNDKDGNKIKGLDANIDFLVNAVRFLSYVDVARFGNSRLGILSDVAIPFGHVDASVGGVSGKQTGLADITINPLSVYYKQGDWLNLGFSPTFTHLPTGRWERRDPASLGRNYASWQPTIGYTMIFFDKLDVSGRFRYIHNFTNNDGAISAVNPTGANYEIRRHDRLGFFGRLWHHGQIAAVAERLLCGAARGRQDRRRQGGQRRVAGRARRRPQQRLRARPGDRLRSGHCAGLRALAASIRVEEHRER